MFALGAGAHDRDDKRYDYDWHHDGGARYFNRIATVGNYLNNADAADETVSEIVAATKDGRLLVYTDSPLEQVGFVDIDNPYAPVQTGTFALYGEPTSVAILGNTFALVGVNTSTGFATPSGYLSIIDVAAQTEVHRLDLGGQPDSVAISPDGRYAAVVIENERDEDVTVDDVEGGLPQLPAGYLVIVDLVGADPTGWSTRTVDLTGLAGYGADDPEPEFVDINAANKAVVSMQENNHIAIVDLASGTVESDFSAGTVTLVGVDAVEDDYIALTDTLVDVPREPDAIAWVPTGYGTYGIATANEGDLFGGSRGFSIFSTEGDVLYDSDTSYERLAVRHGHYPESRSENKGSEPESVEYARFAGEDFLFVGSERGSFVAVYRLGRSGRPQFHQLLPAPLGPEGLLAIPSRGLLIASGESDDPSFGVRSTMMIYRLGYGEPSYPQIMSKNDATGDPIPWSALSGMTAKPGTRDQLLAVWDSYYGKSRIFTIDASSKPAKIVDAVTIQGGTGNYDPEGIDVAPDGTYWIASEGNASDSRPNRLLQTDSSGVLLNEIRLPAEIEACRAASTNRGTLGSGFEGVTVVRKSQHAYVLVVAQQRGWDYTTPECEDLDDDPAALNAGEPTQSRLWIYDPESGAWDHVAYALEAVPVNASWVGLSEVTKVPGGFIVIERDNRTGDFAELKTLVAFRSGAIGDGIVSADDKRTFDLLPAMKATNGWISDKPEGVAVAGNGELFVVTDNDGVDDWSGETLFMRLGNWWRLFR
jgi:hypothetical protein